MLLTICTPTYNRGYLLKRLYHSLRAQTLKLFEWIIIDDGSNDDTKDIVSNFIKEDNEFDIKYFYQNNSGKHVALNKAIGQAMGEYFFIVDSDDWLPNNAVELIFENFKAINNESGFAGIGGLRAYSNKTWIGKTFKGEYLNCSSLQRDKYGIKGDKAEVFYTKVLKQFPFPSFNGENFLTEAVVWYRIANVGYKIRWINQIFYYCEYLDGGLTKTKDKCLKNYQGFKLAVKERLTYKEFSKVKKIKSLIILGAIAIQRKEDLKLLASDINVNYFAFLFLAQIGRCLKIKK